MKAFEPADEARIALWDETGEAIPYGALAERIGRYRALFTARALTFCLLDNDLSSLLAYLAAREAGAVPLLLNAGLGDAPLDALLSRYAPRLLCCPESLAPHLSGRWPAAHVIGRIGSQVLLEWQSAPETPVHDDLALLLATSGSTGSPRLVRLSEKNLCANAAAIAQYLALNPDERAITTLPMSYSYGLSVIHSHLWAGASLVLNNRSLVDQGFWQLLRESRARSFAGVPYSYDMLLRLRLERLDLGQVQTLTQAGGRLAPEKLARVATACQQRRIRFFAMYGQTEATARIAYLPPEWLEQKPGSIGDAIPGGRLWLEGAVGERIEAAGEPGELIYAGDNVALGYADGPEDLARDDDFKGVLRTGDLACCDADGHYTIVGRIKRFIKVFGVRVSLDDAERLLAREGIEAAATGEDDRLCIAVAGAVDAGLAERLARLLDIHPTALRVLLVEHLPRLDNGKIDYPRLKTLGAA